MSAPSAGPATLSAPETGAALTAHAAEVNAVAATLAVDPAMGLSAQEAAQRLARHGPNQLAEPTPPSRWRKFFAQFNELVIWILLAAAIISGAMREWTDSIAILVIVLINGVLGFLQEERAGKALAALRKLSVPQTRVMRDSSVITIAASQLVAGDRIELEAGDAVPADERHISAAALRTPESALTGETDSNEKQPNVVVPAQTPLAERINMIYSGTQVAAGKGSGLVVATGMQTELGHIAGLLQRDETEPTPLQRRLAELGRVLVYGCGVLVAIIFLLHLLRGTPVQEAFLLAVSLAVAAVPEGLPAVVTIALALGMGRMVKRNALVRKLPSVETLGSVSVICTDKTGTLTKNEMTVRELYAGGQTFEVTGTGYAPLGTFERSGVEIDPMAQTDLVHALTIGAWANYARLSPPSTDDAGWRLTGDPTEGALLCAAMKAGLLAANRDHELLYEIPFDSDRKLMSVVGRGGSGAVLYCKGAPEMVMAHCTLERLNGSFLPLTDQRRKEIAAAASEMAGRALRVLGLASRDLPSVWPEQCLECELVFCGLAGMFDPPREEARAAVQSCHAAGIRPVMITGDHPQTAMAIARELGIAAETDSAMAGRTLDELQDIELGERVEGCRVYARVTAEQKLRIVKAWKSRGQVVAMTGDGVNDAPAVHAADIGIAMGKAGTDVTREAADMVLMDDNFATIVAAVEEGRGIFDNIRKFVHYLLSCNTGEVLFMLAGALLGWPAPLNPIQILWINLVTDALPALALGMEPPEPDVMQRPPRPTGEGVITPRRGIMMLLHGLLIAGATAAGFLLVYRDASTLERARTVAFCILSYTQLFYSFACRSHRYTMPQLKLFSNPWLIGAIIVSGLLQLAVFLPHLQRIFHVTPLTWEWIWVLLLSLAPVTIIEVTKIAKAAVKS